MMIEILLNDINFDREWAYPYLSTYLKKDSQVSVIAFVNHEGWNEDYEEWEYQFSKGGKKYKRILDTFQNYQIKESNITFINPYKDSKEIITHSFLKSDIVYLYADNPMRMMQCIEDRNLIDLFRKYNGVYLCNSAASYTFMHTFDSSYDWDEKVNGIGFLEGFTIMSDYIEDVQHLERIIRAIEIYGETVIAFGKEGGVIMDSGTVDLIGNAFAVNDDDLDALYRAYEDAKSRFEYYGDNGLW